MDRQDGPLWRLVREAFDRALGQPEAERGAFLASSYPADVAARVLDLLGHHAAATDFLAPPPAELLSNALEAAASEAPDPEELKGTVLATRYEIRDCLGIGGTAAVYEALDRISGDLVAVKIAGSPSASSASGIDLLQQESTALRLLRLPGVVELLDSGEHNGHSFLVMRRIHGQPYPGPGSSSPASWPTIRRATLSLLEALARVHWAGVAHCDLKPSNVLIESDGTAVILDLGIAQDPGSTERVRRMLALAGTPRYTAPEQLMGKPGTKRSDLYAIGVMLYEALAGRDPHDARDATEVLCFRPNVPPPSLRDVAPDTPEAVARLVDQLISAAPSQRPASAADVLARLHSAEGEEQELPRFLGARTVINLVLDRVREGASVDLHGEAGCGRTSVLAEVADALHGEGRQVVWTNPSQQPFGSLGFLFAAPFRLDAQTSADARAQIESALVDVLQSGVVLLADDADELDQASQHALERARAHGAIVRTHVRPRGASIAIPPLSVSDIQGLFRGPDRLHHIPSDAADEVMRRTGGRPSDVKQELAAWERAGLGRWEGESFELQRPELARLRAGLRVRAAAPPACPDYDEGQRDLLACIDLLVPHATLERCAAALSMPAWRTEAGLEPLLAAGAVVRAEDGLLHVARPTLGGAHWAPERRSEIHHRLANVLPPEEPLRLYHRLMSGRSKGLADDALGCANALLEKGQAVRAGAILIDAIQALRRANAAHKESLLLHRLLRASLESGTSAALDRLLYLLGRGSESGSTAGPVEAVAQAALLALQRDTRRGLAALPALGPDLAPDVLHAAVSTRMFLARQLPADEAQTLLEATEAALHPGTAPIAYRPIVSARAWLAYARDDYPEAARLHTEAAHASSLLPGRSNSLLNAASAWLEAGEFGRAQEIAREVLPEAQAQRHTLAEARAERLLRAVLYRSGAECDPDLELCDAMRGLGAPHLEALVCLNESAVAWRNARRLLAQELAGRARSIWRRAGNVWPEMLAAALSIAAGGTVTESDLATMTTSLRACPSPTLAAQAAHLAALPPSRQRTVLKEVAAAAAAMVPRERWGHRQEIVSIQEVVK